MLTNCRKKKKPPPCVRSAVLVPSNYQILGCAIFLAIKWAKENNRRHTRSITDFKKYLWLLGLYWLSSLYLWSHCLFKLMHGRKKSLRKNSAKKSHTRSDFDKSMNGPVSISVTISTVRRPLDLDLFVSPHQALIG